MANNTITVVIPRKRTPAEQRKHEEFIAWLDAELARMPDVKAEIDELSAVADLTPYLGCRLYYLWEDYVLTMGG